MLVISNHHRLRTKHLHCGIIIVFATARGIGHERYTVIVDKLWNSLRSRSSFVFKFCAREKKKQQVSFRLEADFKREIFGVAQTSQAFVEKEDAIKRTAL